jgi:hypothetical protein
LPRHQRKGNDSSRGGRTEQQRLARGCAAVAEGRGKREAGGGNLEDGETAAGVGIYTPRARVPWRGTGERAAGMC